MRVAWPSSYRFLGPHASHNQPRTSRTGLPQSGGGDKAMQAEPSRPWYPLALQSQVRPLLPRLRRPCVLPRQGDRDRRVLRQEDHALQDLPPNRCAGASGA
eukprot:10176963-Alexandrium_andersonii.AAC.1